VPKKKDEKIKYNVLAKSRLESSVPSSALLAIY